MKLFSLAYVTKQTMLEIDCTKASDVNAGDCYVWVRNVLSAHTGCFVIEAEFHNGSHVFVKRKGLFYDAEHTEGVAKLSEMNYFKRNEKPKSVKMISTSRFKRTWL